MIDLKQLEYFIACVQNGSISKAAQELYTSQPHVSEVIKKLEHSLSTVLFYRSASGIRLTASGQRVYEYATNILKDYQLMELSCKRADKQELAIMSNSSKRMGAFFTEFYRMYNNPDRSFTYLEGGVENILESLNNHKIELGFIFFSEAKKNTIQFFCKRYQLKCELFIHTDMILYAGKNSPLFARDFVTIEELKKINYVQMEEDYFGLDNLLSMIIPIEERSSRIVTTNSNNGMLQMLLHTDLCNLGTYWKKDFYLDKDIRIIPIEGYDNKICFGVLYRASSPLSNIAEKYLDEIKQALEEEYGTLENNILA